MNDLFRPPVELSFVDLITAGVLGRSAPSFTVDRELVSLAVDHHVG